MRIPSCALAVLAGCAFGGDPLLEEPWQDNSDHFVEAAASTPAGAVRLILTSAGRRVVRESSAENRWTTVAEEVADCVYFDQEGTPYSVNYDSSANRLEGGEWQPLGDGTVYGQIQNWIACGVAARLPSGETFYGPFGGRELVSTVVLLAWDGTRSREVAVPVAGQPPFTDITVDGEGRLWIASQGPSETEATVAHWDGTSWIKVAAPPFSLQGRPTAFLPAADGSISVTNGEGTLFRLEGDAWVSLPQVPDAHSPVHCGVGPAGQLLCASNGPQRAPGKVYRLAGAEWLAEVDLQTPVGKWRSVAVTPTEFVLPSTYMRQGASYAVVNRVAW